MRDYYKPNRLFEGRTKSAAILEMLAQGRTVEDIQRDVPCTAAQISQVRRKLAQEERDIAKLGTLALEIIRSAW